MRTQPTLSPDTARDFLVKNIGGDSTALGAVELVIVRRDNGEHRLSFTGLVSTGTGRVVRSFVDAHTGEEILRHDEIQTQAAVGTGTGVLGDRKKVSSSRQFGTFLTSDLLRPPRLVTYDFRGDLFRAVNVVEFGASLFDSDLASDVDNEWEDPAVVDAHVYTGWTYDYYFRRFARRGLDNNDRPLLVLTNAATQLGALSTPPAFFDYVVNAFWCGTCGPAGQGVMFFGNGIPPGFFLVSTGQNVTYLAGSIDIVAHELTHGVTDSTSRLIYEGESGALNEAFSDIIGASVEFFYQPAGSGLGQADYLIGEDSFRALRGGSQSGIRSMADPQAYGDPDHYSRRFTGSEDSGGVHINSAIANHAFYLAIEGGTNRTSRIAVQGVGAGNREQIERVFYRAFVFLLPASARFSTARAATIQAARDLYGVGSGAELAVTRAWTAVGVE
jgi:thermolysin